VYTAYNICHVSQLMSRGVSLCHVAQLDYCIALGAVRSGASSGVRPGLAVWTTPRFLLGALQGFLLDLL
jgi:hypothetical protein